MEGRGWGEVAQAGVAKVDEEEVVGDGEWVHDVDECGELGADAVVAGADGDGGGGEAAEDQGHGGGDSGKGGWDGEGGGEEGGDDQGDRGLDDLVESVDLEADRGGEDLVEAVWVGGVEEGVGGFGWAVVGVL